MGPQIRTQGHRLGDRIQPWAEKHKTGHRSRQAGGTRCPAVVLPGTLRQRPGVPHIYSCTRNNLARGSFWAPGCYRGGIAPGAQLLPGLELSSLTANLAEACFIPGLRVKNQKVVTVRHQLLPPTRNAMKEEEMMLHGGGQQGHKKLVLRDRGPGFKCPVYHLQHCDLGVGDG